MCEHARGMSGYSIYHLFFLGGEIPPRFIIMARPNNTPNISEEKIQEIIELSDSGMGYNAISKKVGVSIMTAYKYRRK